MGPWHIYTRWGISPFDVALAFAIAIGYLFITPMWWMVISTTRMALLFLAIVATTAGVAFRRTNVLPAALAVYVSALVRYIALPDVVLVSDVAVLLALYAVTVHGPRWAYSLGLAASILGAVLISMTTTTPGSRGYIMSLVVLTCISVWALALLRRNSIQRVDLILQSARTAERNAERDAELAVVEERSRIAREMHDIVAHTLSVVIAQADGGRYAAKNNPEAATRALETISEMGRAALADIRSIIGVLRDTDDLAAPLMPQPVDGDLDQLINHVRNSGYKVSLLRAGVPLPLPVGVGNAIFRICQEALTNAMKHAGPHASITVVLRWGAASVSLEVVDDGRGAASIPDGKGHGLVGMAERAGAFGGTVESGPRPGGGFVVRASIPITHSQPVSESDLAIDGRVKTSDSLPVITAALAGGSIAQAPAKALPADDAAPATSSAAEQADPAQPEATNETAAPPSTSKFAPTNTTAN